MSSSSGALRAGGAAGAAAAATTAAPKAANSASSRSLNKIKTKVPRRPKGKNRQPKGIVSSGSVGDGGTSGSGGNTARTATTTSRTSNSNSNSAVSRNSKSHSSSSSVGGASSSSSHNSGSSSKDNNNNNNNKGGKKKKKKQNSDKSKVDKGGNKQNGDKSKVVVRGGSKQNGDKSKVDRGGDDGSKALKKKKKNDKGGKGKNTDKGKSDVEKTTSKNNSNQSKKTKEKFESASYKANAKDRSVVMSSIMEAKVGELQALEEIMALRMAGLVQSSMETKAPLFESALQDPGREQGQEEWETRPSLASFLCPSVGVNFLSPTTTSLKLQKEQRKHLDTTDFLVVGSLGLEGTGKTTLIEKIFQSRGVDPNGSKRQYAQTPCERPTRTEGVNMYVSTFPHSKEFGSSKVIYLDTQPVLSSQGFFEEVCRPPQKVSSRGQGQDMSHKHKRETSKGRSPCICRPSRVCNSCLDGKKRAADAAASRDDGMIRRTMESLAICMWTLSVCDVVVVCNGQSFYETEVLRLIRTARQLLCKVRGSGLYHGRSTAQTRGSPLGPRGIADLLFVSPDDGRSWGITDFHELLPSGREQERGSLLRPENGRVVVSARRAENEARAQRFIERFLSVGSHLTPAVFGPSPVGGMGDRQTEALENALNYLKPEKVARRMRRSDDIGEERMRMPEDQVEMSVRGGSRVAGNPSSNGDRVVGRSFLGMALGTATSSETQLDLINPNECIADGYPISRVKCLAMPQMPPVKGRVDVDATFLQRCREFIAGAKEPRPHDLVDRKKKIAAARAREGKMVAHSRESDCSSYRATEEYWAHKAKDLWVGIWKESQRLEEYAMTMM